MRDDDSAGGVLARALADAFDLPDPHAPDGPVGQPPPERERRRGLIPLEPVATDETPLLTIDEARALIRAEMEAYLAMTHPTYMLLIALPPGAGKTTEAVRQAERFAQETRGRVLYAGPRHELWGDLQRESTIPAEARDAWWYHWQPHTAGDPETGQGQTCRWAREFAEWTRRGHKGFHFCQKPRVCGYEYIEHHCVWHAQKKRKQPIVFVQHMDVVLGHPFLDTCALLIGDESPLGAFLHDWQIPAEAIIPGSVYGDEAGNRAPELTLDADTLELLLALRTLTDRPPLDDDGQPASDWRGPALLRRLGGAGTVHQVCRDAVIGLEHLAVPTLPGGTPSGVDQVPYAHLIPLLIRLRDEAEEAMHGRDSVSRVRVDRRGLRLLLRRSQERLPRHVIWLDATANPDLYRAMFDRDVKVVAPRVQMAGEVHQVYASLNNRDALVGEDVAKDPDTGRTRAKYRSAKRADVRDQVRQICAIQGYTRAAVITYKDLKAEFAAYDTAHFYGLRGSNAFTQHDALIVVGTPQPAIESLADQAAMLHQERRRPFTTTWSEEVRRYGDLPAGYAVSGFWHDGDLHALLLQAREAELVQAAHRVRPLFRPVDVWLLTNLPLPDLPPAAVWSASDLYQAPPGVDATRWPDVMALADDGPVTAADLVRVLGLAERTARRWIEAAADYPGWRVVTQPSDGGRPMRALVKTFTADFRPRVNNTLILTRGRKSP